MTFILAVQLDTLHRDDRTGEGVTRFEDLNDDSLECVDSIPTATNRGAFRHPQHLFSTTALNSGLAHGRWHQRRGSPLSTILKLFPKT